MAQQRVITSLVVVLAFACAANAGFAQTQATTTNGTQTSGDQDQSAAAMAQEAANPFSSRWLMQIQQNNNWMDMPLESGDRVQSNLMFQPLMSVPLTEEWGLTCVRSSPSSIPCPTSIRTASVNERPGSATPSLELPRRVPCSAGGSCSVQARRSRFPRRRSESSARTPGRSAPMSEPRCSARTSSPTPSCSNGSRSAETAGTRTR